MKLYGELMEHELPVYTFSKIGDNEEIEISLGQDAELNIQDILRTFKGFLVASGFDWVKHVDVRVDNTSHIHSSSDVDSVCCSIGPAVTDPPKNN